MLDEEAMVNLALEGYSTTFPINHMWPYGSTTEPWSILLIGFGPIISYFCYDPILPKIA